MADAQIQILIEAQDKVSASLSRIENTITKFGDSNEKASQKMADAWQKGTNKLIAIGNIASGVDNIFSSLTSLELRLENATERLANAQDRLNDAHKDLTRANEDLQKVQKSYDFVLRNHLDTTEFGIRVLEEYERASRKVEDAKLAEDRATRGLTIAENGLARAQNQVIGTYISIGIQSVSLLQSIPTLISSLGVFGLTLGAVGLALGAVAFIMKDNTEIQDTLKKSWEEIKTAIDPVLESLKTLVVAIWPILKPVLLLAVELFKYLAEGINVVVMAVTLLIDLIKELVEWLKKISIGAIDKISSVFGGNTSKITKVGDAIIRPNGEIIETDPRDTIIATKNPGMGSVNIYIESVNGLNPDAVADALKYKLKNVISI